MIAHRYGKFSKMQVSEIKKHLRGSIFFLLQCADPETASNYPGRDINEIFQNIQYDLDAINSLLFYPLELVPVIELLEAARVTYNKPSSEFKEYRKLLLDAGVAVLKLKEGD